MGFQGRTRQNSFRKAWNKILINSYLISQTHSSTKCLTTAPRHRSKSDRTRTHSDEERFPLLTASITEKGIPNNQSIFFFHKRCTTLILKYYKPKWNRIKSNIFSYNFFNIKTHRCGVVQRWSRGSSFTKRCLILTVRVRPLARDILQWVLIHVLWDNGNTN